MRQTKIQERERERERETHTHTHRQTDRQTDRGCGCSLLSPLPPDNAPQFTNHLMSLLLIVGAINLTVLWPPLWITLEHF